MLPTSPSAPWLGQSATSPTLFLLCIGNPLRSDDGLGPRLAVDMRSACLPGLDIETAFQPEPEHAEAVSRYEWAIMVDSASFGAGPFTFTPVAPDRSLPFCTHALSPGAIALLARGVFAAKTEIFLLGIRGYSFGEGEGLTVEAESNLQEAEEFLVERVRERRLFSPIIE